MSTGLAAELRAGTRKAHTLVESAALVRAFLRGVVDAATYTRLLGALQAIYTALEEALEGHREDPRVGPVVIPALFRREPLARDLAHFGGVPADPLEARLAAAVAAYVSRLSTVAATRPELLVAHAYVRHLGDLSGGQILGAIVARTLAVAPPAGVEFYRFEAVSDPAALKDEYRRRLDALPIDPETRGEIIAEAILAFELNLALFQALEGSALVCLGRMLRGPWSRSAGRRARPAHPDSAEVRADASVAGGRGRG